MFDIAKSIVRNSRDQLDNLSMRIGRKKVSSYGRIHQYPSGKGVKVVAVVHVAEAVPGIPMLLSDPYRLTLDGEVAPTTGGFASRGELVPMDELVEVPSPVSTSTPGVNDDAMDKLASRLAEMVLAKLDA